MLCTNYGTTVLVRPAGVTILALFHFSRATAHLLGVGGAIFLAVTEEPGAFAAVPLFGGWSALSLICGYGLWRLKSWSRTFQLGWAWLGLLGFPIGTMTSIPILIYLYRPQIKTVFAGKALDQLSSEEIKTLGSLSKLRLSLAVPITFGFLLWHSLLPAIFIPNMVNAIQRGKQTRTVAEIRSIAAAIEDYTTDHKSYPEAHTLSELRSVLVPQYLRFMPKKDGWGHPLRVRSTPREYTIQAAVMDGVFEERPSGGPTTDFGRDIVFSNGAFVQWPEGPQK